MSQHGLTHVELLLCVFIAAVLAAIAVPYYQSFMQRTQANLLVMELAQLVTAGRTYAMTNHRAVSLCGSSDRQLCDQQWSEGILMFEDHNRDGQVNNADRILSVMNVHLGKAAKLSWKGFSGNYLPIESFGTPFASNGTFTYCTTDQEPLYRRQIVVNRGGRVRVSHDKNGDGVHEDSSGNVIACVN